MMVNRREEGYLYGRMATYLAGNGKLVKCTEGVSLSILLIHCQMYTKIWTMVQSLGDLKVTLSRIEFRDKEKLFSKKSKNSKKLV